MAGELYTIGHSTQSAEDFFNRLKENGISVLVDVRSTPYSRFASQFNKEILADAAKERGIQYIHEAEVFGARRKERDLYSKEGFLDFDKVRALPSFKQKVAEYTKKLQDGENVVLMCSEKNPMDCHRAIMVGRGFSLTGVPVSNILLDGKILPQEELDKALVNKYFPGHNEASLFEEYQPENDAALIAKAYALQNKKVGYKLADLELAEEKQAKSVADSMQWEGVAEDGSLLSTEKRIGHFRGQYGFLSNMYDCPVFYNGVQYKSSEAAYQAQRCANVKDKDMFKDMSGVEAKKMAKQVETRKDWHFVKTGIMQEIVDAKFRQNRTLANKLVATGDKELVEGNKWRDTFWGVYNGRGKNMLGQILMNTRALMRKELDKDISIPLDMGESVKREPKRAVAVKNKDEFTIAVTGHRPNKLFGYDWKSKANQALSSRIETVLKETIAEAEKQGYQKFRVVTGMALGADQMFMANAIRLASIPQYKDRIVLEAAVPCNGQEKQWPEASKRTYNVLLAQCNEVTVVTPGAYTPKAMQDRNEYMVDKADILLSVYDGKTSGGTRNCIDYAKKKGVMIKDIGLPALLEQYPRYEQKKSSLKVKLSRNDVEQDTERK